MRLLIGAAYSFSMSCECQPSSTVDLAPDTTDIGFQYCQRKVLAGENILGLRPLNICSRV